MEVESQLTGGLYFDRSDFQGEVDTNKCAAIVIHHAEDLIDPAYAIRGIEGRNTLIDDVVCNDVIENLVDTALKAMVLRGEMCREEADLIHEEALRILGRLDFKIEELPE